MILVHLIPLFIPSGGDNMGNAIDKLINWGMELPYWQQLLLDKIIFLGRITEEDAANIYTTFKQETLLEDGNFNKAPLKFHTFKDNQSEAKEKLILKSISEMENINALLPNQTLTFSSGITVIYGGNGAGKSGYARVLASGGFTRGDKEILSNVFDDDGVDKPKTAKLIFEADGEEQSILYTIGDSCELLSKFYIFDSTSVEKHLSGKHEYSFVPYGLDYFSKLAIETDRIGSALQREIGDKLQVPENLKILVEYPKIQEVISSLTHDTSESEIHELTDFTTSDRKRLTDLPVEMHRYSLDGMKTTMMHLEALTKAFDDLLDKLFTITMVFSKESLESINQTLENNIKSNSSIHQVWDSAKSVSILNGIDEGSWAKFLTTGAQIAEEIATTITNDYPATGLPCFLCNQPLTEDASDHIRSLLQGIRDLNVSLYNESEKVLQERLINLTALRIPNENIDFPL